MPTIRMVTTLVLALGLGATAPQPVSAAMLTGRDLAQCGERQQFCAGYVMGLLDQWRWLDLHVAEIKKCRSDGLTTVAMLEIVTGYVTAHPDGLDSPAPELIRSAFVEAFSC